MLRAANELEKLLKAESRVPLAVLDRPDLPCPIYVSMSGCNFMRIERSLGGFAAATSRGTARILLTRPHSLAMLHLRFLGWSGV
jgi:hypothetical protein